MLFRSVLEIGVLGDVVLIRKERTHTAQLEDTLAAIHNCQLVLAHQLFSQFLIVERVGGLPSPALSGVVGVDGFLAQHGSQLFEGSRLFTAQEDGCIHVTADGICVILIDRLELTLCLQHQTGRDFTASDGGHQLFQLRNLPDVSTLINQTRKGADVIFQDAHVSGHACQEEIKLIYTLIHPKYAVPVHGEYKHLKAQAKIAESLGISKDNIFILSSGDVLEVSEEQAKVNGRVPVGAILVDGLGVGDVGNVVLRDRQHLAEDGIMIVVMSLDKASGELVAGPDIVSRGFVYVKESDELIEEARRTVDDALQACLDKGITDWGKLKTTTKDVLGDYVWKKTKRRPMILPIIMEV